METSLDASSFQEKGYHIQPELVHFFLSLAIDISIYLRPGDFFLQKFFRIVYVFHFLKL